MSAAETLLGRLQGVRKNGPGKWLACCPAHEDKRPSLSIREMPDGTLLVHCFAGCDSGAILKALGMTISELFPKALAHGIKPHTRGAHHHAACEALRVLQRDALMVAIAASDLAAGRVLCEYDLKLLFAVAGRARHIAEMVLYDP